MTKKDFELIARTIRDNSYLTPDHRKQLAEDFARALMGTNPQFNRPRFIAACLRAGDDDPNGFDVVTKQPKRG